MHVLQTAPNTFPTVLTMRICSTIQSSLVGDHFLYLLGDLGVTL